MDKKTLVNDNIEVGKKLLEILDQSKFDVRSAFWFYFPDLEEWRLVLAIPSLDKEGPRKSYTRLNHFLNEHSKEILIPLEIIKIISPKDRLNELLSMAIKTGNGISDIRFTGNVVNGVLIQDSYLYRVN